MNRHADMTQSTVLPWGKLKMKKILVLILLAMLSAGLAGCASNGGQASALERAQYA